MSDYRRVYVEIIKQTEAAYVCVPARVGYVGIN